MLSTRSIVGALERLTTPRESAMRFMRLKEVLDVSGLSRSTLARLEGAGSFPRRRPLSSRTVGWPEDEVLSWVNGRKDMWMTAGAQASRSKEQ